MSLASGLVTTLAGNISNADNRGYSDGSGVVASFAYPEGVAVGGVGTTFAIVVSGLASWVDQVASALDALECVARRLIGVWNGSAGQQGRGNVPPSSEDKTATRQPLLATTATAPPCFSRIPITTSCAASPWRAAL